MRKTLAAAVLLGFAAVFSLPASAASPDRAADIRKTAGDALKAGAPKEETEKALTRLVFLAGEIGKDGKLAGPPRARLDAAAEKASKSSLFEPTTSAAVREAYAALNGSRPFAFPEGVKGIDDAKTLFRTLSEKSIQALKAGRTEEAARDLLGCVLAFITPMEAGP